MGFREKILSGDDLPRWREQLRQSGRKLVVTNGCFDVLHLGHATYLETARQQGDVLLVGVNGDNSVRQLKGPGRPLNPEWDRAAVLAALESVNAVSIFVDKRAVAFSNWRNRMFYVKGGDYTLDTLDQDERRAVEHGGGRIGHHSLCPGRSTTGLIQRFGQTPAS